MSKEASEDTPSGHENIRRVYALPAEMVDRITEFQAEKGLASEVEAVRRLLDEALKSRDDLTKIINRFLSKLGQTRSGAEAARTVLVGHPKVKALSFEDDDVIFWLKSDDGARISETGSVTLIGHDGFAWERGEGGPFSQGKIDSEIPF